MSRSRSSIAISPAPPSHANEKAGAVTSGHRLGGTFRRGDNTQFSTAWQSDPLRELRRAFSTSKALASLVPMLFLVGPRLECSRSYGSRISATARRRSAMSADSELERDDEQITCFFEALADEIYRHALLRTVPTHADIARWAREIDLLDYAWRQEVLHHERIANSPPRPRLYIVKPDNPAGGAER